MQQKHAPVDRDRTRGGNRTCPRADHCCTHRPGPAGRGRHADRPDPASPAQVDTVHPRQSLAAQPGTGTPGATPQVGCDGKVCPVGFAQAFQQGEVHRIEHGIVVGGRPAAITGGHVHGAVVAGVEVGKVEHGTKHAEVGADGANSFPPRLLPVLSGRVLPGRAHRSFPRPAR